MARCEQETVIVANAADIDEGFITVWTTEKRVRDRMLKRFSATITREAKSFDGTRIIGTDMRVPWGKVRVGLLAAKPRAAVLSAKDLKAKQERGRASMAKLRASKAAEIKS